jgi:hypothetical protein
VVPIYKGDDCWVVRNDRLVGLISVVCKQMQEVIAGFIRQVWLYGYMRGNMASDWDTHVKVK